jgi:hypothetical protein
MFFMAIMVVLKHVIAIIRKLKGEGYKKKYDVTKTELVLLWVSISYLLSTIFVGIKV